MKKKEDNEVKSRKIKLDGSVDFDFYVNELQDMIDEEEERLYSETVRKEYRNPSNIGTIKNSDGYAKIQGTCGDTVAMFLKINEGKIENIKYQTDGCGITVAVNSMLTKLVSKKSLEDAMKISPQYLTDIIGGLPEENLHCAKLSVMTLQAAIENYYKSKKS